MRKALQLDLPVAGGEPLPLLYVQMDGTGVPVVKKETQGRKGKSAGQPAHTREVKLACIFTQTAWDEEGYAIAIGSLLIPERSKREEFGRRIYLEAWNRGWSARKRKLSWATAPNGFGISPISTSRRGADRRPLHAAAPMGPGRRLYPTTRAASWMKVTRSGSSTRERSKNWSSVVLRIYHYRSSG